ncbi:MAG: RnfABCDGE type electron transport complex subunit D, partial [Planctomycetota bacterium]
MSDAATSTSDTAQPAPVRVLAVDTSPHLNDQSITTRGMMRDVLIALAPAMVAAIAFFGLDALRVLLITVFACLAAEWLLGRLLARRYDLFDGSAAITGVILGLSLPWSAPWWLCVLGALAGIGLGKMLFGGLGYNIFNPAMVGRAFVMLSFAGFLGAPAYLASSDQLPAIVSQATPLTVAREALTAIEQPTLAGFGDLFLGGVNGSLGETSALALLLGGIYL